jgi:hypothetical protein
MNATDVRSLCTIAQARANQEAVVERIINRAKPRLAGAGFELLSLRLTALSIARQ